MDNLFDNNKLRCHIGVILIFFLNSVYLEIKVFVNC